nr:Major facilitator superfamily general substrate transporter [Hymenolepis microstoma]
MENKGTGDVSALNFEDVVTENSKNKQIKNFLLNVAKTVVLFFSWCCLGLYAEVLGPSLQTYINVTGTNSEEISHCFSMRELGMFFGSLVGAFFADRFVRYRNLTMASTLILGAVTIGAVPFCFDVLSLSATFFFSGCAHGAMTANGNPLLNSIWLEKSGGPFNFMHSGYGVGAAIAPGLLAPYTYSDVRFLPNGSTVNTTLIHLHTPYYIVAGLCCFVACLFCSFNFCFPKKEHSNDNSLLKTDGDDEISFHQDELTMDNASPRSFKKIPKWWQTVASQSKVILYIVFPTFLLFGALVGNERVFSKFIFVFANEGPAKLSKDDCLLLTGVYWIVFALARVITVPVSLIIPLPILFAIQLVGAWAMALGLYLGPATRMAYLAFTICFGLFKSPLFPTALGLISMATPITGVIVFFVNLGSSLGASGLQAMAGAVLHRKGRHMFPLLVMISGAVLIFIGVALIAATHLYKKKYGSPSDIRVKVKPNEENEMTSQSA